MLRVRRRVSRCDKRRPHHRAVARASLCLLRGARASAERATVHCVSAIVRQRLLFSLPLKVTLVRATFIAFSRVTRMTPRRGSGCGRSQISWVARRSRIRGERCRDPSSGVGRQCSSCCAPSSRPPFRAAHAVGSTCTGKHGVGLGKRRYSREELGAVTLALMRRLKRYLDSYNTLNPGKIIYRDEQKNKWVKIKVCIPVRNK